MTHDQIQNEFRAIQERHEKAETSFEGLGVIKDARNLQNIIAGLGGLPDHLQHVVTGLADITDSISKDVD